MRDVISELTRYNVPLYIVERERRKKREKGRKEKERKEKRKKGRRKKRKKEERKEKKEKRKKQERKENEKKKKKYKNIFSKNVPPTKKHRTLRYGKILEIQKPLSTPNSARRSVYSDMKVFIS